MYVARDKDGHLWLYEKKPLKQPEHWACVSGDCQILDINLFPEVKWSDPEPRKLVLKPIKEELGFVNLYKDGGQVKVGWKIFPTKKEAEENFKDDEKYITTAMITFEEFADAYAAAVPKILAKMKYLERIGRNPFDENKPLLATR